MTISLLICAAVVSYGYGPTPAPPTPSLGSATSDPVGWCSLETPGLLLIYVGTQAECADNCVSSQYENLFEAWRIGVPPDASPNNAIQNCGPSVAAAASNNPHARWNADNVRTVASVSKGMHVSKSETKDWSYILDHGTWDQGQCGDCWAFNTARTITAAARIQANMTDYTASPQWVTQWPGSEGDKCGGGWPPTVISNLMSRNQKVCACDFDGSETDVAWCGNPPNITSRWLYSAVGFSTDAQVNAYSDTCDGATVHNATGVSWNANSGVYDCGGDFTCQSCSMASGSKTHCVERMTELLHCNGPLSIAVDASGWNSLYASDIEQNAAQFASICASTDPDGTTQLDHAVSIVGDTKIGDVDYWIVQNQWGAAWGSDGKAYAQKGLDLCGLESVPISVQMVPNWSCDSATPAKCEMSDWGAWGPCDAGCTGNRTRTRTVITHGTGCGQLTETIPCSAETCCFTEPWGAWSACSASCGSGTRKRTRGGSGCSSTDQKSRCNTAPCTEDCRMSEWSAWGTCTRTCGGGTAVRTRHVLTPAQNGGTACPSNQVDNSYACNTEACPVPCTDCGACEVSDWGAWDACSSSCAGGTQLRRRSVTQHGNTSCPSLEEHRACGNKCASDCVTSDWGAWDPPMGSGKCSASCYHVRHRTATVAGTRDSTPCSSFTTMQEITCTESQACGDKIGPTKSTNHLPVILGSIGGVAVLAIGFLKMREGRNSSRHSFSSVLSQTSDDSIGVHRLHPIVQGPIDRARAANIAREQADRRAQEARRITIENAGRPNPLRL